MKIRVAQKIVKNQENLVYNKEQVRIATRTVAKFEKNKKEA